MYNIRNYNNFLKNLNLKKNLDESVSFSERNIWNIC